MELVAVKIGCLELLSQKSQFKSNALLHLISTLAHFRCSINVTESNWILKQKRILQFKLEQILSGLFIWIWCFILSSIQICNEFYLVKCENILLNLWHMFIFIDMHICELKNSSYAWSLLDTLLLMNNV